MNVLSENLLPESLLVTLKNGLHRLTDLVDYHDYALSACESEESTKVCRKCAH